MSIHLPHRLAAMDFYRRFGNADITSYLLAKAPPRELNHDFSPPGTQGREALSEVGQRVFILSTDAITRQAGLNSVKKLLIAYWLREELDRATFHGLHRHRNIAVPCDKDDWELAACRCELTLEFKSALPRQPHVQY